MDVMYYISLLVVWTIWTIYYVYRTWDNWKDDKLMLCTYIVPMGFAGAAAFWLLIGKGEEW